MRYLFFIFLLALGLWLIWLLFEPLLVRLFTTVENQYKLYLQWAYKGRRKD